MKKTFYTLCIAAVFVSCNLDEFPLDKLAPENYFNNEAELKTFTNTFYQQNFPEASSIYSESADVIIVTTLQPEVSGTRTVVNEGGGWDIGSWQPLTYINNYLHYSHRCSDTKARERYDGVARFFRAYFYFEKVKRFGDVPWYDRPLKSDDPDLYKARDPRELVMSKILEDIDYAIDKLPQEQNVYSVTQWTALALKSRICLFEGTFRKYHGIAGHEEYLDECIEAAERFIDESPYQIYKGSQTPYRDLFSSNNAISTEVILARDYEIGLNIIHNANNYTLSNTYGMPGLNKKIVDSYLKADGSRFTDVPGYATMEFYQEMQDRDPRLTQTVRGPGYTRIGQTDRLSPDFSCSTTGYQLTKWVTDPSQDGYNKSYNDIILFRAAEVYLNFAEAKAERGTLTQTDIDKSIKPIRDRVGMPNLDMEEANDNPDPYLTNDVTGYPHVSGENKGVILEIRRERTVELVMEPPYRSWDLFRWNECKQALNHYRPYYGCYIAGAGTYDMDNDGTPDLELYIDEATSSCPTKLQIGKEVILSEETKGYIVGYPGVVHGRNWDDARDYLWPIPAAQRTLNPALTQNPGWDDGLKF